MKHTFLKKFLAMAMVLALVFSLCACNKNKENLSSVGFTPAKLSVFCLSGPTGVGMVDLMNKSDNGKAANNYTFTVATAPEQVTAQVINKTADIACIPTNLAANLYAKTKGQIEILAVNTLSVLYLLDGENSVKSFADLKGKTVYMTGQGANPEFVFNHLLVNNNIDPKKDITIKFVSDNQELAALMASGKAKICVAPQPIATAIGTKTTIYNILPLADEWARFDANSQIMMGCVVAQKSVIQNNPEAVEAFLTEYKASIENVKNDVDTAATLCEKYEIISPAAMAKKAIPQCGLAFVAGKDMKTQLTGYLKVLYDALPASIGGTMPDDNFWHEK